MTPTLPARPCAHCGVAMCTRYLRKYCTKPECQRAKGRAAYARHVAARREAERKVRLR